MTPEIQAAYLVHETLMLEYEALEKIARDARAKVARDFYLCAQGQGTGPDNLSMVAAEHAEAQAAAQWKVIKDHIDDTFPG